MPDALEPRVAAETLLGAFRSQAENLRPFDPAMQDDLVQEMALAVLLETKSATQNFFLTLALWRARDFLRGEMREEEAKRHATTL